MVILAKPYGGPSNRLFQHIHLDAFCREHGVKFANRFVSLDETNSGGIWPALRHVLLPVGAARLLRFEMETADYSDHERVMREEKIVFVQGWAYRNLPLTRAHRAFYSAAFYRQAPKIETGHALRPGKANIAIHIRREDYAHWMGGKFFFPDSVYMHAIERMSEIVKGGCRFLLFTDDPRLDATAYLKRHPDMFIAGPGGADQYLMSLCDYIIGAPSTFSSWASYIGKVPCCHIQSATDRFDEDSFFVRDG